MSPGEIATTLIGSILLALFSVIGVLLKGRFDSQDIRLSKIETTLDAHGIALAALTASQTAALANQKQISETYVKLYDEVEELQEETDQLQFATKSLHDRSKRHEEFLEALRGPK